MIDVPGGPHDHGEQEAPVESQSSSLAPRGVQLADRHSQDPPGFHVDLHCCREAHCSCVVVILVLKSKVDFFYFLHKMLKFPSSGRPSAAQPAATLGEMR